MKRSGAASAVRRPLLAVILLAAGLVVALPVARAEALTTTTGAFGAVAFGSPADKVVTITNNLETQQLQHAAGALQLLRFETVSYTHLTLPTNREV